MVMVLLALVADRGPAKKDFISLHDPRGFSPYPFCNLYERNL